MKGQLPCIRPSKDLGILIQAESDVRFWIADTRASTPELVLLLDRFNFRTRL